MGEADRWRGFLVRVPTALLSSRGSTGFNLLLHPITHVSQSHVLQSHMLVTGFKARTATCFSLFHHRAREPATDSSQSQPKSSDATARESCDGTKRDA